MLKRNFRCPILRWKQGLKNNHTWAYRSTKFIRNPEVWSMYAISLLMEYNHLLISFAPTQQAKCSNFINYHLHFHRGHQYIVQVFEFMSIDNCHINILTPIIWRSFQFSEFTTIQTSIEIMASDTSSNFVIFIFDEGDWDERGIKIFLSIPNAVWVPSDRRLRKESLSGLQLLRL